MSKILGSLNYTSVTTWIMKAYRIFLELCRFILHHRNRYINSAFFMNPHISDLNKYPLMRKA